MPRTSAEALIEGRPLTIVCKGTLLAKPFVELFVKGIRVGISRWEQFNPRLSLEVITHQKGIVFRLYPPA